MGFVRMIGTLVALSVLAGCAGESSRVEKVTEELQRSRLVVPRAPDRHPYGGIGPLHEGDWVTYREGERRFMLTAGAREGDAVWIEVVEEAEPRQVSARLVGPDGVVRKAYYGEIWKDGRRSAVEPQPLEQASTAPAEEPPATVTAVEAPFTIGGRRIPASRLRWSTEDLEGRRTGEELLWSREVSPVFSGSKWGGLVLRRSRGRLVELQDFGRDARLLLELPR